MHQANEMGRVNSPGSLDVGSTLSNFVPPNHLGLVRRIAESGPE